MDNMVGKSRLITNETMLAYQEIAPFYEEYSKKKKNYLNSIDNLVINQIKQSDRLLDIGSGDGRRLMEIKQKIGLNDVVAVEPNAGMVEVCKKKYGLTAHQIFAEDMSTLEIGKFDVVTALWNVFGHLSGFKTRLKALQNIAKKLNKNGILMLDINNRYNASAYGSFNIFKRIILDTLNFKESRGDATYDWEIEGKKFKSTGHLFTPNEIEKLFNQANLKVTEKLSVNYNTGVISPSVYQGQLFYVVTPI